MSEKIIRLRSTLPGGESGEVILDVARGARIHSYITRVGNRHLQWLYPMQGEHGGCFVMVPFCSRVRNGQFHFNDRDVALFANSGTHALHGHGLTYPWQLQSQSEQSVVLGYDFEAADWPWPYRVQLDVSLQGLDLDVSLQVRNLGSSEMPLGMGLHPYFPLDKQTTVSARVEAMLALDDELMPKAVVDMPKTFDVERGIYPSQHTLDHVFLGSQNHVTLRWPERNQQLLLRSAGCHHLVIYSPHGAEFVCVEPVSNIPDAFNVKLPIEDAFQRLNPAEQRSVSWRFEPTL